MQADAQDVLRLLLRDLPRRLQPPEQQRAMAALACTCAALRDGVAARCAGQLDIRFTASAETPEHTTAFACWLSHHGHLLRSLELNLAKITWDPNVERQYLLRVAQCGPPPDWLPPPRQRIHREVIAGEASSADSLEWLKATREKAKAATGYVSRCGREAAYASTEPSGMQRCAAQRAAQQELEQALRSAASSLQLESFVGVGVSADMAQQLPAATLRHLELWPLCATTSVTTSMVCDNQQTTAGDCPVTSDTTWGDLALPSGHLPALTSFCAVAVSPQDIQTLGGLPAQLRQLTVLVRKDDDCVLGDWTSSRPPLRLGHVTGLEQLFLGATDRYYDTEPTFAILPDDELPPALQSLGAADALSVAPLAPLKGLRELQLMDCKVPAGQLAQLSTLTQLTGLTLVYNLAGDPQVEQASAAWPLLAALREVDLEHSCDPECCGLSDIPAAAAEHAAAAKGLTRLVVLGEERPVRRS